MSQGELRTMAFLSREPTMMKIYTENLHGGDMHAFMANEIAKKRHRDTWSKEDRTNAKPINFGCMYGAEWYTLQQTALNDYGVKFTEQEAKFFRDEIFFATFPKLPEYFKRILRELRTTKGVRGPLGNFRRLPEIDSYDENVRAAAFREAINTPNQGLSSAIALTATFLVAQIFPWIPLISFNHDATYAHVEEERAEEAATAIKRCYEIEAVAYLNEHFDLGFDIPIKAEITIGDYWK
jgi:DNA polymerase I-like protein with 3'-5' exonuclease and polymerase domains